MPDESPSSPTAEPKPAPGIAAYFDVDGTLTRTNIVQPLIWYKTQLDGPVLGAMFKASLVLRGPYWFILDRINRAASNRSIYRSYQGMDAEEVRDLSEQCYTEVLKPRILQRAIQRVKELKQEKVKIVLVTGGLDFVMNPFARDLGATCICPSLHESRNRFTGALSTGALSGETKANAVRLHAEDNNIDLAASYAFGDSYKGDLAMLEAVGHPSAVNPDTRLRRIAVQRGWPIEKWK